MNNNELLKNRWGEVDEILSTFYTNNQKINRNMYNRIQDILNGINYSYDELYKPATVNQVKKFRNKVDEIKDKYELKGYTGYTIDNLYKRTKLKNSEILIGLLTLAYYEQMMEQNKQEKKTFDEIKSVSYIEGQKEYIEISKKKRAKIEYNIPKLSFTNMIAYNGYKWTDYKEGNISYNTKLLFGAIAIILQQNKKLDVEEETIIKILIKQNKSYFSIKETESAKTYTDAYYGSLDNQVVYLANQYALAGMKKQGCKKVRFIAVLDEKTTDMCESLDNQVFSINGWNTYSRYSAEDKKNIIYTTKGLEVGANLPPITNSYHHCRSTIYPER